MPRYRKLHVKTLESEDINDMPDDFTRLFWVLLPLGLDREGRGRDKVSWLKSRIFPMRSDVTPKQIADAMDWFWQRGMIARYAVAGRSYFCLPTFARYQGDTSKEAESEYPAPPELCVPYSRPTPDLLPTKSAPDSDSDSDATTDADAEIGAAAPSPAPPEQKTRREKAPKPPPAEKPPAVLAFHEVVSRWPNRATWEGIAQVVGHDPPDLERWERIVRSWIACGYNPLNVKGMLQCYHDRRIPGDNGRGKANEPAGFAGIRELIAEEGWDVQLGRHSQDHDVFGGGVSENRGQEGDDSRVPRSAG